MHCSREHFYAIQINILWSSRRYLDPKRFAEAAAEERDDLIF